MKKAIAIVGTDLPECAAERLREDFYVVTLPRDNSVAPQVSSHPDMILTIFDNKIFCHRDYYAKNRVILDELSALSGLEVTPCGGKRSAEYPEDVAFNVLPVGNALLGRTDSMADELRGYPTVNTRQGYAGCTALFAAGHVISADPAILRSCRKNALPSAETDGEGISLPGYDKGFIGGACGVYGDTVYVCGEPDSCPAGISLKKVCRELGLSLVSLCGGSLLDVGGIKFVPFSIEK